MRFGQFLVQTVSEERKPHYILRELLLQKAPQLSDVPEEEEKEEFDNEEETKETKKSDEESKSKDKEVEEEEEEEMVRIVYICRTDICRMFLIIFIPSNNCIIVGGTSQRIPLSLHSLAGPWCSTGPS